MTQVSTLSRIERSGEELHKDAAHRPQAVRSFFGHIPELDGIRGLAAILVLMVHMPIPAVPAGSRLEFILAPRLLGVTGLDLFLVLSGFLIGGILLDTRETTNYFRVFYARRVFRIMPVYGLLLLVVWLGMRLSPGLWVGNPTPYNSVAAHEPFQPLPWLSYLFYVQNFVMAIKQSWGLVPLSVTWSLAVEEQFYLTLPLMIRFLPRRILVGVMLSGIAIAPILRAVSDRVFPNNYFAWYTLLPCRIDGLFLGVLVAILVRDQRCREIILAGRRAMAKHWALLLLALGVVVAGLAFMVLQAQHTNIGFLVVSGFFSAIAILWSLLLLNTIVHPTGWLAACLRWRWLGALGTVSYSVYLSHTIFILLFFHRSQPIMHSLKDVVPLVATVASIALFSALSWRFYEKPLLRFGYRWQYQSATKAPASTPVLRPDTPIVRVEETA